MTREKLREKIDRVFNWGLESVDDILLRNEIQANRMTSASLFNLALISILAMVFAKIGIISTNYGSMLVYWLIIGDFLVGALYSFIRLGRGKSTKYVILTFTILGVAGLLENVGPIAAIFLVIPLLLSERYFNVKFSIYILSLILVIVPFMVMIGALHGNYAPDILHLEGELSSHTQAEIAKNATLHIVMPIELGIITIVIVSINTAIKGKQLSDEDTQTKLNSSRIENELKLAQDIQANMLPRIFPPFPDHSEFDIYAFMKPAKEVGGDFYDFFMIDDTHVAIVIGDVSGKGVPAALFMVTAKTLIKDYSLLELNPAEVFTRVNKMLSEGNDFGLFVTSFLGVLDINSGLLTFVNAGHNPPLIMGEDGNYTYLKSRRGLVLAGLDSTKYKANQVYLKPNDRILLYTDGVTEANNPNNELYSEERLLNYMNNSKDASLDKVINGLYKEVTDFQDTKEQFDDVTMLILHYLHPNDDGSVTKTFLAETSEIDKINEFLDEEFDRHKVGMKDKYAFTVSLEEMFTNVCKYAYPDRKGNVKIQIKLDSENNLSITLKDSGIPFNPLLHNDPDITESANERKIGGLGIFMVKKMMDNIQYDYKDSMNIFTMTKKVVILED